MLRGAQEPNEDEVGAVSDIPKVIEPRVFSANAELLVDGNVIYLRGRGSIDHDHGIVRGDYETSDLPADFDPYILKTVMITGYPSVCQSPPGQNPFHYGAYRYEREVDFGEFGAVAYRTECAYGQDEDELESAFKLEGSLHVPALRPAEPVVETWIPAGREVLGDFTIAWPREDGQGFVVGRARTRYSIPDEAPALARVAHRLIRFPITSKGTRRLHITQISEVRPGGA